MTEIVPGGAAVLVGMNNPYGADPRYALYPLPENSAGGRLFAMLQAVRPQTRLTEYRDAFERVNLCAGEFNRVEARARAGELRRRYDGRTILLLGRDVQRAFGMDDAVPGIGQQARYDSETSRHTYLHWVPHPSGRNPFYNDSARRRVVGLLLARMISGERGLLDLGLPPGVG